MKAVLQRVSRAEVRVNGAAVGGIGAGLVALIAVERGDGPQDADTIARKISGLRIFPDSAGKMNQALGARAVLAISQFTLCGDTRRGMRPSFDTAARPEEAQPLYEAVVGGLRAAGVEVATGVFRADMELELVNDGPVTLWVDSRGKTTTDCGA